MADDKNTALTLDACIAELTAIRDEYGGDLLVLHENDWLTFAVDGIRVEMARDGTDPILNCAQPTHIVLTGERMRFNSKGRLIDGQEEAKANRG